MPVINYDGVVLHLIQDESRVSQPLPKRYACELCDKRFVRPTSLMIHTYSHTGEVSISNMKHHKKGHSFIKCM